MKNFKRFFTFNGYLYFVEGSIDPEASTITVYSAYEMVIQSAMLHAPTSSTFTVNSPTQLLPQSCYFPEVAKRKLFADIVTDFAREKILAADPNANPS